MIDKNYYKNFYEEYFNCLNKVGCFKLYYMKNFIGEYYNRIVGGNLELFKSLLIKEENYIVDEINRTIQRIKLIIFKSKEITYNDLFNTLELTILKVIDKKANLFFADNPNISLRKKISEEFYYDINYTFFKCEFEGLLSTIEFLPYSLACYIFRELKDVIKYLYEDASYKFSHLRYCSKNAVEMFFQSNRFTYDELIKSELFNYYILDLVPDYDMIYSIFETFYYTCNERLLNNYKSIKFLKLNYIPYNNFKKILFNDKVRDKYYNLMKNEISIDIINKLSKRGKEYLCNLYLQYSEESSFTPQELTHFEYVFLEKTQFLSDNDIQILVENNFFNLIWRKILKNSEETIFRIVFYPLINRRQDALNCLIPNIKNDKVYDITIDSFFKVLLSFGENRIERILDTILIREEKILYYETKYRTLFRTGNLSIYNYFIEYNERKKSSKLKKILFKLKIDAN